MENVTEAATSQNISIVCDDETPYSINIDESGLFEAKILCTGKKKGQVTTFKSFISVKGAIIEAEKNAKEIIYITSLKAI